MAMSDRTSTRITRKTRPAVEGLEGRAPLSTTPGVSAAQTATTATTTTATTPTTATPATTSSTSTAMRRYAYTTQEGARVVISMYGVGQLNSTADPSVQTRYNPQTDALDLIFSGTNEKSAIVAQVHGGTAPPRLELLQHALLPAGSLSGIGSSLINVVNLKNFDLIAGGRINLTGGVHMLMLNSIGPNTQINLRDIPPELTSGSTSTSSSASGTENGVTLGFLTNLTGARTLTSVEGDFIAGFNLFATPLLGTNPAPPGPPPAPPGVVVMVNRIDGAPRNPVTLGDPVIFGFDPVENAVIPFDGATGARLPNAISLDGIFPADTVDQASVSLAHVNGHVDVLADNGQKVVALNPTTGQLEGSFSLTNLKTASTPLPNPTRITNFNGVTVVADPMNQPGDTGLGRIQPISLAASLTSHQAVPLGAPYDMQRAFGLTGGLSGLPGSSNLYAAAPPGSIPISPTPSSSAWRRSAPRPSPAPAPACSPSRASTALSNSGKTIATGPHGQTASSPNNAMGSIGLRLALDTGLQTDSTTGQTTNTVTFFNPSSDTSTKTVQFDDPHQLSGLSAAYYPSLAGSALIDVQGNTQSLRARTAQGLVFNGEGNVNLVKIDHASDTLIRGYPFGHAAIPDRQNVQIVSTGTRNVGPRNDVTVIDNLPPTGPLSLP